MDRPAVDKLNTRWAKKWDRTEKAGFYWRTDDPHRALREVLPTLNLPPGGALDVGCGDGIAVRYLADHFSPSVGIDFAPAAIDEAVEGARREGSSARFVVGDVTKPPFSHGTFAFLFDRGCYHTLPPRLRATFFLAMDDLLAPGGAFYLMATRDYVHKAFSRHGIRQRVGRLLHPHRHAHWPQADEIKRLKPASWEIISFDREDLRTRLGKVVINRFLFRKQP